MPVDISAKLYYAASCTFSDTIKVVTSSYKQFGNEMSVGAKRLILHCV